jgi:hypothetical protein
MNIAKLCNCGKWWSDTGRGHTSCKDCRMAQRHQAERKASRKRARREPVYGSAAWAETCGDNLGYSGDY